MMAKPKLSLRALNALTTLAGTTIEKPIGSRRIRWDTGAYLERLGLAKYRTYDGTRGGWYITDDGRAKLGLG